MPCILRTVQGVTVVDKYAVTRAAVIHDGDSAGGIGCPSVYAKIDVPIAHIDVGIVGDKDASHIYKAVGHVSSGH